MSDLVIDGERLDTMVANLKLVREEFQNANSTSSDVAEAVGHRRLGDRVRDFAHNWDRRRQDLVEQLETVELQLNNIREQFANTDAEMKSGLDGNG